MNPHTKEAMFALHDVLMSPNRTSSMVVVSRKDLYAVVTHLFRNGDEWSNQAAFGYAIAAAEQNGMSIEDIQKLVNSMRLEMDNVTLEEAADIYRKSDY